MRKKESKAMFEKTRNRKKMINISKIKGILSAKGEVPAAHRHGDYHQFQQHHCHQLTRCSIAHACVWSAWPVVHHHRCHPLLRNLPLLLWQVALQSPVQQTTIKSTHAITHQESLAMPHAVLTSQTCAMLLGLLGMLKGVLQSQ